MSRSEVDEKNSSLENCSVKIMQMRWLSSLDAIRRVRVDKTFFGGEETAHNVERHGFAGWKRGAAGRGALGLAAGCSPRGRRCPGTAGLGEPRRERGKLLGGCVRVWVVLSAS